MGNLTLRHGANSRPGDDRPALLRNLPLGDGRLAIVAGLLLVVGLGVALAGTISLEQARDWAVYQQAADRLLAGRPLYVFDRTPGADGIYLYPPPGAAFWAVAGSQQAFVAVKIAFLCLVGVLALIVTGPGTPRRTQWLVAGALIVAALAAAPDLHDFALGNVMAFYVGAVALSVAVPGWVGAVPLGVVCAAALKPVIGPYLLWLFLRRRSDGFRVVATGLAVSVVVAAAIGPGRYLEYVSALPQMSFLFHLERGNVGLGAVGMPVAMIGVLVAYATTIVAAKRLTLESSAALAIAAGLLAQPTIGFNYLGLLIPAAVLLWKSNRTTGFAAIVVLPPLVIVSAPLSAALVMVLAFFGRRPEAAVPATVPPAALRPRWNPVEKG